jgi:VWFA-related protein
MRSVAALLLILCLAVPLSAQTLSESIKVVVVNVDVVVTDRTGKHVTGLTSDDFEISEEQRPPKITNFSEVRAAAMTLAATAQETTPMDAPQRRFVFFIDNDSLHPMIRDQVVQSMKRFIEQQLRPGDEASVVSWNNGIQILQVLTSDKTALKNAADRLRGLSSPDSITTDLGRVQQHCIRALDQPRGRIDAIRIAYEDCINGVRSAAMQASLASKRLTNAMSLAITTMAGMEGKKVLVLASTRLPEQPGYDMYIWANQLFAPRMRGFDAAMARPIEETRKQKEVLDDLARTANAHGVALYLLDAAVLTNPMPIENARTIPMEGGMDLDRQNTDAAFQMLAARTGGVAVTGRVNFDDAFATVARDLDSYYSLGYRPSSDLTGDRSITVKARNREYTVRARQGYAIKSFDDQMKDRVVANIFAPRPRGNWNVSVRTGKPERDGRNFKVLLEVSMPSTVALLPKGEDLLVGGFTVYIAVGSPQGALSTVSMSSQPVGINRAAEAEFRKQPIVWTAMLSVAPGRNVLSIGVVDQVSNTTGFARTTIVAE